MKAGMDQGDGEERRVSRGRCGTLVACVALAWTGPAAAATVAVEEAVLAPTPAPSLSRAAAAVAIDGDLALVGVPGAEGGMPGVVHAFRRSGGEWAHEQTILNPDTDTTGDNFGWSIAMRGGVAVIGAPGDGGVSRTGAAWRMVHDGARWDTPSRIDRPAGTPSRFGWSVALNEEAIVVGAPATDSGSVVGAVVVFGIDGSGGEVLRHADADADDLFGRSVALSDGGTNAALVVGAPGDDRAAMNAGAAYLFARTAGGTWEPATVLRLTATSAYGSSVAVSADATALAVGAPSDGGSGAVYVHRRAARGDAWPDVGEALRVVGAATGASDYFGTAVAMSGTDLVVGAPNDDDGPMDTGSAFLFRLRGSAWVEVARFRASGRMANDRLGTSVAISGTTVLAGAPRPMGMSGFAAVFPFPSADGATCAIADRCESGHCVDGVCCESVCGGGLADDCVACGAGGACEPVGGECTACGMVGTCSDGECSTASACDAGPPPRPDGSVSMDGSVQTDGGLPPRVRISGCKCEAATGELPHAWWLGLMLALVLVARRATSPRRRRARCRS